FPSLRRGFDSLHPLQYRFCRGGIAPSVKHPALSPGLLVAVARRLPVSETRRRTAGQLRRAPSVAAARIIAQRRRTVSSAVPRLSSIVAALIYRSWRAFCALRSNR